jgi:hypothetical protein
MREKGVLAPLDDFPSACSRWNLNICFNNLLVVYPGPPGQAGQSTLAATHPEGLPPETQQVFYKQGKDPETTRLDFGQVKKSLGNRKNGGS